MSKNVIDISKFRKAKKESEDEDFIDDFIIEPTFNFYFSDTIEENTDSEGEETLDVTLGFFFKQGNFFLRFNKEPGDEEMRVEYSEHEVDFEEEYDYAIDEIAELQEEIKEYKEIICDLRKELNSSKSKEKKLSRKLKTAELELSKYKSSES